MTNDDSRIRSMTIVGGGTAGWMAAAAFARHFQGTDLRIRLIESDDIGTIGVGEATIPTLRRFYAKLGMSDASVMRATGATAKLGILFEDWRARGDAFLHPFGLYGEDFGDVGFHHYAFALRSRKDVDALQDFLQDLGATIVDPAGEYYDDYYAVFFLDPDGLKLEGMKYGERRAREARKRATA